MKKYIVGILLVLMCSGCLGIGTKKNEAPTSLQVWWGNRGDEVAWTKAKEVMENHDWIVTTKALYDQR